MLNNVANLIPKLDFKKETNCYHFEADEGILKIKFNNTKWDVKNIDLKISNDITVSFIMESEEHDQFKEKELDLTKSFPRFNDIEIHCTCEEYKLTLSQFTETNASLGPKISKIYGKLTKIIIKNGKQINWQTNVNIWDLFETENILQSELNNIKDMNLSNIYLKTLNPEKIKLTSKLPEEIESMDESLKEEILISDTLLNHSNFLFYNTKYSDKYPPEINAIENLIMFYESNIVHLRMKIIENIETKNLEIIIESKNTTNLKGKSIFDKSDENFLNFISTSYINYINAKDKNQINIDLLMNYYVWIKNEQLPETKLLLCSEFMEVYKNNFANESKNEKLKIFKRLQKYRLPQINLNPLKLLEIMQPEIYGILQEIKQQDNRNRYKEICDKFEETCIVSIIQFNRNKIIHSGNIEIQKEDIDLIIKKWIYNFIKEMEGNEEMIRSIGESIKRKLECNIHLFDIRKQAEFMEYLIEIILLSILKVNCKLCDKKRFKTNINGHISYDTKDYIKQFQ